MLNVNSVKEYSDSFEGNPGVKVTLIGEPITLRDGSEFGILDFNLAPSGIHNIRAVRFGATFQVEHTVSWDKVLVLGDGNDRLGVMAVARASLPNDII